MSPGRDRKRSISGSNVAGGELSRLIHYVPAAAIANNNRGEIRSCRQVCGIVVIESVISAYFINWSNIICVRQRETEESESSLSYTSKLVQLLFIL